MSRLPHTHFGWAATLVLLIGAAGSVPFAAGPGTLEAQVERAVARDSRHFVNSPDRFEILTIRVENGDAAAAGQVDLELIDVSGPNQSGILRATFRIGQGGVPRGQVTASVRGTVRGPVLVAARILNRGTRLTEEHVRVEDTDITRLLGEPLREPADLEGMVPLRTLSRGRVIEHELLRPAPVVRRGQVVDLVLRRGTLTVVARGQALADAAPGEIVEARNADTGVRVNGEAQADGSVLVLSRSINKTARQTP